VAPGGTFKDNVFVEASSLEDVRSACKGLSHIRGEVSPVSLGDSVNLLQLLSGSFMPLSRSWVRIARPALYRQDLAFILDIDNNTNKLNVIFVPRISDTRTVKRKSSGNSSIGQKTKAHRPSQALFNDTVVKAVYGEGSVVKRGQAFVFNKMTFQHGFVWDWLPRNHFFPSPATPTTEELVLFQSYPDITLKDVSLAYLQRITPDDNVKVVAGQLRGLVGRAVQCEEDSVVVEYMRVGDAEPGRVTLHPRDVRKKFSVGDQVRVFAGPHLGAVGWVTGEMDIVSGDDKGNEEVIKDRDVIPGTGVYDDHNMQCVCLPLHDLPLITETHYRSWSLRSLSSSTAQSIAGALMGSTRIVYLRTH
jgi:hypothetical protein